MTVETHLWPRGAGPKVAWATSKYCMPACGSLEGSFDSMFITHFVAVESGRMTRPPPSIHLRGCDDSVDFFLVVLATYIDRYCYVPFSL